MAPADGVTALHHDLQAIFGPRLLALVVYHPATPPPGAPIHTLATMTALTAADLHACADRIGRWHPLGLATPLFIPSDEFARALDAFPLEFAAILADYEVVAGSDPFAGLSVDDDDMRRACEVKVRSHLLHLREGYVESRGRGPALAELIADSAAPLGGLLVSIARLLQQPTRRPDEAAAVVERAAHLVPGSLADVLRHGSSGEPARRLFDAYLGAIEGLAQFIDRWSRQ